MITILSLNIANYDDHPHWDKRKYEIAGKLFLLMPDIICFQEVRFNPTQPSCKDSYQNSAEEILDICRQTGFLEDSTIISAPTMYYPPDGTHSSPAKNVVWEGKSIITCKKIIEYGNLFLSTPSQSTDNNRRSILWCRLQNDPQEFVCANIHWSLDEAGRQSNALETAQFAERFADVPLVICGDFNCDPDSSAHQKLSLAGLQDVWSIKKPADFGYTYPTNLPESRLDQFWINRHLSNSIIGIYLLKSIAMSDHAAIMINIAI
jgi:endonuclease/exonuclease/phosphatase family metal-dependent hydrolase